VVQIGGVMSHIAAILPQIASLFANFLPIALASGLANLTLVPRDVARIVPQVALVLRDVPPIVPHVAAILTNVTALLGSLAELAPLLLRERLRGRRSCLRGGLGDGTRAREHNEGESHHS